MKTTIYQYTFIFTALLMSCGDEWLDEKRDSSLIVPTTLNDMTLLLNSDNTFYDFRMLSELSADDYYVTTERWTTRSSIERNAYIWNEDIYNETIEITDWDNSYDQILAANVVIKGLSSIARVPSTSEEWDRLKGAAHYMRGYAFYNLASQFAKPFDIQTAAGERGIILKLDPDINSIPQPSSIKSTYEQILSDIRIASTHLPISSDHKVLPSKPAAFGLLSRCYLSMRQYDSALFYAQKCLSLYDTLVDYNTIAKVSAYNGEVIHHRQISPHYGFFGYTSRNYTPIKLYESYENNDLRKVLYFNDFGDGNHSFKGSYTGSAFLFSGIAVDEVYLIRAESYARLGETDLAIKDLNTLLEKRFITGTFTPYSATSNDEVLKLILTERRKELIRRGIRWTDLRRLNFQPELAMTIERTIQDVTYSLLPGDKRYVFPFPSYVTVGKQP